MKRAPIPALILIVIIAWLVSAAVLMNVVGTLHDWWLVIPTMPYAVALKLGAIGAVGAFVGGVLKAIAGSDD